MKTPAQRASTRTLRVVAGKARHTLPDMDYEVSQLHEIDAVEIVDLRGVLGNRVSTFMREAVAAPFVRLEGEGAQNVARLWRLLPPGEAMRCHVPSIGLRFYRDETLLLQASLCWDCNNIFIDYGSRELFYAFDANSADAQELLRLME